MLVGSTLIGSGRSDVLTAIDVRDGETLSRQRGFGKANLIHSGRELLVLTEDGDLVGAELAESGVDERWRVSALGGKAWTVPTVADGRVYVRDTESLKAFRFGPPPAEGGDAPPRRQAEPLTIPTTLTPSEFSAMPVRLLLSLALLPLVAAAEDGFVPLFDGESIADWSRKGGEATYAVEDGAIVGTTKPNTPNTFLCPPKQYGDFELRFEVKCDPALNSGVQLRSADSSDMLPETLSEEELKKARRRTKDGSLTGPQCEIAANGNAGGVWFEAVGGWLLGPNESVANDVYKKDDWNAYRVRCEGNRILVEINGTVIVDGEDERTGMRSGHLGFQVHGVGKREDPLQVRWRDVEIKEL